MTDIAATAQQLAGLGFHQFATSRDLGRGTAFPATGDIPGGLQTDDRFYRTDVDWLCYYDGTRWLTVHEMPLIVPMTSRSISANGIYGAVELRSDYAPYITRVTVGFNVSTTNNATNFWGVAIRGINAAYSAATTIHGFDTSAATASTWTQSDANTNTQPAPSNRARIDVNLTKSNTPGNIEMNVTIYHRLIVP